MVYKFMNEKIYNITINDIKRIFKERPRDTNKGDYGIVGIMGGSLEYSGAIKLANMSAVAVRSGTGVVRVIVPDKIANSISPYLLEQTLYLLDTNSQNHMKTDDNQLKQAIHGLKALAVGMGWGKDEEYQKIMFKLLELFKGNLIIDADGINTLAEMDLNLLKKSEAKVILTPHPKEFERISKINIEEIKKNSVDIAKSFANEYKVILLLKGEVTVVTDGDIVYLVDKGCAGMATAGSGDVLSGVLAGMLGYCEYSALTISAGAFLAGVAGEMAQKKYTDIAMRASDTIKYIPNAIKYIRENEG